MAGTRSTSTRANPVGSPRLTHKSQLMFPCKMLGESYDDHLSPKVLYFTLKSPCLLFFRPSKPRKPAPGISMGLPLVLIFRGELRRPWGCCTSTRWWPQRAPRLGAAERSRAAPRAAASRPKRGEGGSVSRMAWSGILGFYRAQSNFKFPCVLHAVGRGFLGPLCPMPSAACFCCFLL